MSERRTAASEKQLLQEILNRYLQTAETGRPFLIAIDGRCASGKTTLAEHLAKALNGKIFHLDDYFLTPEQRTKERLETPGENVDHERFLEQVLLPAKTGKPVTVQKFDCSCQSLGPESLTEPGCAVIIEGSYCLHPALKPYYDLTVFLDCGSDAQKVRLRNRESSVKFEQFIRKWIPLEESYIRKFHPDQFCSVYLNTTGLF